MNLNSRAKNSLSLSMWCCFDGDLMIQLSSQSFLFSLIYTSNLRNYWMQIDISWLRDGWIGDWMLIFLEWCINLHHTLYIRRIQIINGSHSSWFAWTTIYSAFSQGNVLLMQHFVKNGASFMHNLNKLWFMEPFIYVWKYTVIVLSVFGCIFLGVTLLLF